MDWTGQAAEDDMCDVASLAFDNRQLSHEAVITRINDVPLSIVFV